MQIKMITYFYPNMQNSERIKEFRIGSDGTVERWVSLLQY